MRRVSFKSRLSSTTARTFWRGREREREREREEERERERREGGREREIKEVAIKKKERNLFAPKTISEPNLEFVS